MAEGEKETVSLAELIPEYEHDEPDSKEPENAADAIDLALAAAKEEESEGSGESTSESSDESSSDSSSDSDSDSDDNEEDTYANEPQSPDEIPRTKNELDETVPRLPEGYTITEETRIEPIGKILTVGNLSVVIKTETSGEYRILADGTVFCLQDRTVIGPLCETFGPVEHPLYVVKFASEDELEPLKDLVGQLVCYVVPSSNYIFTETLKSKGSDASNFHDEEVPLEEQEFSDDEKEALAKQAKKKRKRKPQSQSQSQPQPQPQSQSQSQSSAPMRPYNSMQNMPMQNIPMQPIQSMPMQNMQPMQGFAQMAFNNPQAAQQAAQWYYYQALVQAQNQSNQNQNQNSNQGNPRGGPPSAAPPY